MDYLYGWVLEALTGPARAASLPGKCTSAASCVLVSFCLPVAE
jgi:hypothetical protein